MSTEIGLAGDKGFALPLLTSAIVLIIRHWSLRFMVRECIAIVDMLNCARLKITKMELVKLRYAQLCT